MTDYRDLRAKAEAATPGPWQNTSTSIGCYIEGRREWTDVAMAGDADRDHRSETYANAAFIAAANPQTILDLLAEREADKARIAELEAECDRITKIAEGRERQRDYWKHCFYETGNAAEDEIDAMSRKLSSAEDSFNIVLGRISTIPQHDVLRELVTQTLEIIRAGRKKYGKQEWRLYTQEIERRAELAEVELAEARAALEKAQAHFTFLGRLAERGVGTKAMPKWQAVQFEADAGATFVAAAIQKAKDSTNG